MVTVRSQRLQSMVAAAGMPQDFVTVDDETHLNDVSKLLARQVLGIDLPKFSGDVKEWPNFITTYRRTTKDGDFLESKNMDRLRECILGPARNCVRMIFLTNNAEKLLRCLKRIMVGSTRSSNS
jgi:hypothetical protein